MTNSAINPGRLALARQRRGISKTKLAELIGVQVRSISAFEKGEFSPSDETLEELARHLRFPVTFFTGDDIDIPDSNSVSFRALTRMTAGERDAALGASAIGLQLSNWIEERFDLPTSKLPEFNQDDPEAAAEAIRSEWGLGYRPISNVIHLLESKGIRVFSLAEDTRRVDAFSFWYGETPFIFLNTKKSAERSRFDAAHELGHLLLHKHGGPAGRIAENQANSFASSFLMPSSSVWSVVKRTPTVSQLVKFKKRWIVSVAALLYRLWKLHIVTDWQYRSMCAEISPYRTKEPEPAEHEISQVLPKIFDALTLEGVTKNDIAEALSIHRSQLEELVFGLVLTDGGVSVKVSSLSTKRPNLKIIK